MNTAGSARLTGSQASAAEGREAGAATAEKAFAHGVAAVDQSSTVLRGMTQLAATELQVAVGSVGRMLLLLAVMGLLLIFAWLGLSVLVSWSLGAALESVAAGLASFLLVQVLAFAAGVMALRSLADLASMPATRRQVSQLIDGLKNDAPRQDSSHPRA